MLTHKIFVTQDVSIKQRPYWLPTAKLQVMRELIDEMLVMDVIEHWSLAWSFPVVLIPRKDRKPRFCVNSKCSKLNVVTYTDTYPLPTIQQILDSVFFPALIWTVVIGNTGWIRTALTKQLSTVPWDYSHLRSCLLDLRPPQLPSRGWCLWPRENSELVFVLSI